MYKVNFYKGDYSARQEAANKDRCVCYIEHHFNANEGKAGNYVVVILGNNASDISKKWGRLYAQKIHDVFGVKVWGEDGGILVGGYNGRGDGNIRDAHMPAILVEPLFANNEEHASYIKSEPGQQKLAQVLVNTIREMFPNGGTVGFSVGHKYKTSKPNDRGTDVFGGGTEADYAEKVLNKAKILLDESKPIDILKAQEIKVVLNDKLKLSIPMSSINKTSWKEDEKKLYIYGEEKK